MTLTEKLEIYMAFIESKGIVVSETGSIDILAGYYLHVGMPRNIEFLSWLKDTQDLKYPAFASVTRAIRKARELHKHWQKPEVVIEEEVTHTKVVVGY